MNKTSDSLTLLLTLTICAWILLSLFSVSLLKTREIASGDRCRNNLRILTLGIHNYHRAYKCMPLAAGGSSGTNGYGPYLSHERASNRGRLSGFAPLLPFIDQPSAWAKLKHPIADQGIPTMGPVPSYDPSKYKLWSVQFDAFVCPSDSAKKQGFGMRSYVMNYGDTVDSVGRLFFDTPEDLALKKAVGRGAFVPHTAIKFRDCNDGLSNTLLFSETKVGNGTSDAGARVARGVDGLIKKPSLAQATVDSGNEYRSGLQVWAVGKGSRWPEGSFVINAFTTVMPPNGPSATLPGDPESGVVAASSYHPGGVNVVMVGAEIRFVSNTIDVGDLNTPSVSPMNENAGAESPYGVWGAMGTRYSKEIVPGEREAAFKSF